MTSTAALCALLSLLCIASIAGYNITNTSTSSSTPKICILSDCNLYAVSNVCGRYGSSNLCKRFNNSCLLRYENCISSVNYTSVALSQCSGIATGSRRRCVTSSSSTSGSSYTPIIINRRRG
ncbi:hypothetical protein KR222_010473 [Zaprionus bogoriensis]|nr:hypothetical protein KR222_010473 [Zaprionus bogoriensis]